MIHTALHTTCSFTEEKPPNKEQRDVRSLSSSCCGTRSIGHSCPSFNCTANGWFSWTAQKSPRRRKRIFIRLIGKPHSCWCRWCCQSQSLIPSCHCQRQREQPLSIARIRHRITRHHARRLQHPPLNRTARPRNTRSHRGKRFETHLINVWFFPRCERKSR